MSVLHRSIIHFDLDAFYVHVEYLRDKNLRGKPMAVGGQSDRGVITSCSYEARKFGVRSAMSSRMAKRLCPDLIIVGGDMDRYIRYSNLVTEIISQEVPVFEKSSIDEFYIDMTGMDRFFGIMQKVVQLREKIIRESGLSISYALATNKLISKVATNECKPDGQSVVMPGNEKAFLAPLQIEKLPMVGNKTSKRLHQMGIFTIGDLSERTPETLIQEMGRHGIDLWKKSNGVDHSPVIPYHQQKSIGTENTFYSDTNDIHFLFRELTRMTEKISFDLRSGRKMTGCVTVKIKYSDFQVHTMQEAIDYTGDDYTLIKKAREIFEKLYDRKQLIRLIGVRFTKLVDSSYQMNIFDIVEETIGLHRAVDSIKKQFGENFLFRASGI